MLDTQGTARVFNKPNTDVPSILTLYKRRKENDKHMAPSPSLSLPQRT